MGEAERWQHEACGVVNVPAVRDIHFTHPSTAEPGLWVETASGLIGKAKSDWPAISTGGSKEARRAELEAKLNAALQALFERRIPLSSIPPDDPIILDGPEPGCRIEGSDYVIRDTTIFIPVLDVIPEIVLGAIELTEAASRSVYVW